MEYISSIERVRSEQRFLEGVNVGEQRGELRGEQRGEQKGVQGGKTAMLSRLLTRRFGPLPAATHQKIKQATIMQIEAWFDRGIDAQTLDEVFQTLEH